MKDLRQSPAWGKYLKTIGWKAVKIGDTQALVRPLPLVGSIIKIQRPRNLPLDQIEALAKRERAFLVKIEPLVEDPHLKEHRFRKDHWPLLPPKTLVIDLTPGLEEIKKTFSKDARQAIKKSREASLGLRIITGQSKDFTQLFNQFYKVFKETGRRQKFLVPSKASLLRKIQAFGNQVWLACIVDANNVLAGAVVLNFDKTAFYHHAAASPEGRQQHAAYLLLWEIIKKAKAEGLKTLDLEGTYDPRFKKLTKDWQGFTTFKRKFGGQEVTYPGSYIKYRWPFPPTSSTSS